MFVRFAGVFHVAGYFPCDHTKPIRDPETPRSTHCQGSPGPETPRSTPPSRFPDPETPRSTDAVKQLQPNGPTPIRTFQAINPIPGALSGRPSSLGRSWESSPHMGHERRSRTPARTATSARRCRETPTSNSNVGTILLLYPHDRADVVVAGAGLAAISGRRCRQASTAPFGAGRTRIWEDTGGGKDGSGLQ